MAKTREALVRTLLSSHGRTYAEEAGIRLADRSSPLYQLLVLTTLLSKRISAGVAAAAARELFAAGYRTPREMVEASWQDRVDALGRAHYRRYDESTATILGEAAEFCLRRWRGDLRRLRTEANGDPRRLRAMLTEFPGIGPSGADIFTREVQGVWPEFRPFVDGKVVAGAKKLHLPATPTGIAEAVDVDDLPRFASALVRVALHRGVPGDLQLPD